MFAVIMYGKGSQSGRGPTEFCVKKDNDSGSLVTLLSTIKEASDVLKESIIIDVNGFNEYYANDPLEANSLTAEYTISDDELFGKIYITCINSEHDKVTKEIEEIIYYKVVELPIED